MRDVGGAIRRATLAATRLHRDLGVQARIVRDGGRIDVFDTIARLDVPLLFKPLEGLLGAYLNEPVPGVLITTRRPLSVQRFTAAHELGHHQLGHRPSLDDESILRRSPFAAAAGGDMQEVEADAFASAFLLPRWLVAWHCERQGWTDEDLHKPEIVYQLALRAGASYLATCWTLSRYNVLSRVAARQLADIELRTVKQRLLGEFRPADYYADVWLLTDKDVGHRIEGGPADLFVVRLREHSGSGYLWRLDELDANGFAIVDDGREDLTGEDVVGGPVIRRITTQSRRRQSGEVRLSERRPWQPAQPLHTVVLPYDLTGPEREGWSRAERRQRLQEAA